MTLGARNQIKWFDLTLRSKSNQMPSANLESNHLTLKSKSKVKVKVKVKSKSQKSNAWDSKANGWDSKSNGPGPKSNPKSKVKSKSKVKVKVKIKSNPFGRAGIKYEMESSQK